MAFSYKWGDLTAEVSRMIKGVPMNWPLYCNMVSSDMFTVYPWRDALQTVAVGQIPLVDTQQDYDVPTNIYRLTKATIVRTDVSPKWTQELDVQTDLDESPLLTAPESIKAISLQNGQLRLDSSVRIPAGATYELHGEYQVNSPKVKDLTDWMWFQDQYAHVAFLGLMYWGYKISDDSRAGTAQTNRAGTTYTGQLGEYKAALQRMREDEEYGPTETYYPAESMGADGTWGTGMPNIFGGR